MGSDPQYAKYPDLSLAQDVFNLANSSCPKPQQQASQRKLQQAISEHKMAPLYYHLAHPTTGVLNVIGEGSAKKPAGKPSVPTRRGSITSNLLPTNPTIEHPLPWDESLYEKLKAENEKQLEEYQKEETEAEENAGETEVQQVRGKRAEFWARVGDKDKAIAAYETVFEKTGVLGTKIDLVLALIRIGLFFGDKVYVKTQVDRANMLVESGGDWDRRNRLKAYKGLHLMTIRSYNLAAPLLLDSLSTFTSYELCSYSNLVVYSVLAGSLSLKRVDFKSKVVDAPEIKAILGSDSEERFAALAGAISSGPAAGDEEMKDSSSATPGTASTAVNLTTLGSGSGSQAAEIEKPMDFSPLSSLVSSLYQGSYHTYFQSLAAVEVNFLLLDRYLFEHRTWFIREMRLLAYTQFLQSYRVVGIKSMANNFGVSVNFLDKDLARFIASGRINCTIDRVGEIVETNRPDSKNKQYAEVVKQGDALITKLQKYGQAVRLRGSERS